MMLVMAGAEARSPSRFPEEEEDLPASQGMEVQMVKVIRQMMDVMRNHENRAEKRESERKDRSRSRRKKQSDPDSDDDENLDVSAALGRYGLHMNVAVLPQLRVLSKCVKDAKRSVKAGGVPIITGKLDERFIPSGQRAAAWAVSLDKDKLRFQTWWSLWWGRAHTQLLCQAVTNKQLFTLGQVHEWHANISSIALSESASVAMKYDEMGFEQLVAQAEARAPSLDTGALLDLNSSLLARAKQAVEKLSKSAQTSAEASSSKGGGEAGETRVDLTSVGHSSSDTEATTRDGDNHGSPRRTRRRIMGTGKTRSRMRAAAVLPSRAPPTTVEGARGWTESSTRIRPGQKAKVQDQWRRQCGWTPASKGRFQLRWAPPSEASQCQKCFAQDEGAPRSAEKDGECYSE